MSRRAFTIVIVPLLLAISLVVLGVILSSRPQPAGAATAYSKGKAVGPAVGAAALGIFMVLLASRIAERKSYGAATWIFGGILALANFAMLMNVLGLAKPVARNPPAAKAPIVERSPNSSKGADASSRQPAIHNPAGPPSGASTAAEPIPAPPSPPKFDVTPVTEPFAKELDDLCAAFAQTAAEAFNAAAKPKRNAASLDAQITALNELKTRAAEIAQILRDADDELERRLRAAGAGAHETSAAAIEFDNTEDLFFRAGAADDVGRFAEVAITLFEIARDNLAKITIDATGKVSSKDRDVEMQLFAPRAQFEFALRLKDDTLQKLRGP